MITATEVPAPALSRQGRGDLSSVRLTTPAGTLRGDHALEIFEAIQRRRC
jgi:hypothetical protein